jgi:hypothetical protein
MQKVIRSVLAALAIFASAFVAILTIDVSGVVAVTAHASKTAFCNANIAIDKASASVTSNAGFLAVLKTHTSDLKIMQENAPSGSVGTTVQQIVQVADKAIAANNANDLNSGPDTGDVDTYCGVAGNGQPLPAYFDTGKSTTFCATFLPVYGAVGNATSAAGRLAVLTVHKAQIEKLGTEASALPSSIKATATGAVANAEKVIATKNASLLANGGAADLALYCGQNE